MLDQTIIQLRQLKLSGMANALVTQQEQPGTYEGLSFEERLQILADNELNDREHRKQQRLLKAAKLKIAANPQDIDYQHPRGLKRSLVVSLLQCDWINKNQNLLLTGPCGSGKTYIACALAHAACMKGYRVKYYRLSRLLLELTQTKADGSYSKALQNLARLDLLILDDWGLEALNAAQRNDLMEIMDDRNGSYTEKFTVSKYTEPNVRQVGCSRSPESVFTFARIHNSAVVKLRIQVKRKNITPTRRPYNFTS